jgi:hypothetical protein
VKRSPITDKNKNDSMKTKFPIFIFLILFLYSCKSSQQVTELQSKVKELENCLIDEHEKNAIYIITNFLLRNEGTEGCKTLDYWIKKEESYKKYDRTITFDSLKVKYNRLVVDYNKLSMADHLKADSIIFKRSEIVKQKFDDYRKTRKQ